MEKWIELEEEIHARSGLDASVFNTAGIRITNNKKWANRLCPVSMANPKGQTFICSTAHRHVATQAEKKTGHRKFDAGDEAISWKVEGWRQTSVVRRREPGFGSQGSDYFSLTTGFIFQIPGHGFIDSLGGGIGRHPIKPLSYFAYIHTQGTKQSVDFRSFAGHCPGQF